MNIEFVRFQASDGVELQGWLSEGLSEMAVVHIHGMSGNGYENYFLDHLRQAYLAHDTSFFSIDTRGRGIISSFWQGGQIDSWGEGTKLGGSCYELFEESVFDIQGAIDFLVGRGKSRIILQGHSLGGSKVVHYMKAKETGQVEAVVLLAPTDMVGWASMDSHHHEYLARAKELLAEGKGEEWVAAQCWLDQTPLSAQTYPTICGAGTAVDIYGRQGDQAALGYVSVPMLIAYGDKDIGIEKIDGSIEHYRDRLEAIKNKQTRLEIIKGASHSFKTKENDLSGAVSYFLEEVFGERPSSS